jgi:hypothetical protein
MFCSPPFTTAFVFNLWSQKLEENAMLIKIIHEKQSLGHLQECIQYVGASRGLCDACRGMTVPLARHVRWSHLLLTSTDVRVM